MNKQIDFICQRYIIGVTQPAEESIYLFVIEISGAPI